jgi:hypothetical protein
MNQNYKNTHDQKQRENVKNHNQQKKIENYYWKNMDKKKKNNCLLNNNKKETNALYKCKGNQAKVNNKTGNWEKAFAEELNRHKETLNIDYAKSVQRQRTYDYAKQVQKQRTSTYAKPVQSNAEQHNEAYYEHGAKRKLSPYNKYGESCTEKEASVGIDCSSVQAHVDIFLSCQTKLQEEQKIELLIKNTVCPAHSCQEVEARNHRLKMMSIIIDLEARDNYSDKRKGKIVVNRECYGFNNLKPKHSNNLCRQYSKKEVELSRNGIEINTRGELTSTCINMKKDKNGDNFEFIISF